MRDWSLNLLEFMSIIRPSRLTKFVSPLIIYSTELKNQKTGVIREVHCIHNLPPGMNIFSMI